MIRISIAGAAVGLFVLAFSDELARAADLPLRITVEAGEHARIDSPVSVSLKELNRLPAKFRLSEIRDGKMVPVPFQLDAGHPPRLWWIMDGKTPAQIRRTYVFEEGPSRAQPAVVIRVHESKKYLEIARGESRLLRYNSAPPPLPSGADPKYTRSGYINPVWTPRGQVVTDRAQNYLHQLGVWLAYVGTQFEGRTPNFWDLLNGKATVQYAGTQHKTSGPVFAAFTVTQHHLDLGLPGQQKVALKETWTVRAWNVGAEQGYWLYDVMSTIRCAGSSPLTVTKHTWGGMAIRGAPEWYNERCRVLTSEGKTRSEANHTRVRWCDLSGSTQGVWSGMTVMSHPQNLRHPEPVRVNETIPYFCFVDSYLGDFQITPTNPLVLRYRFFVHDDAVRAADAERLWRDFAAPPKTAILSID